MNFDGERIGLRKTAEPSAPGVSTPLAIIGAGPAGLTAGYVALRYDPSTRPLLIEASDQVGGIARTINYKGNRFDIGGHRFFTTVPEINGMWLEVLGSDFLEVKRLSRIYYRGKFYSYPLQWMNALANLGLVESIHIVLSYLKWQLWPHPIEETFEQWMINRFGGRLFLHFFQSYTEKVWGMPCSEIRAGWAAQRVRNLSLLKVILNAFLGTNETISLIDRFHYPRLGPGMMWDAFRDRIMEYGGQLIMNCAVERIVRSGNRVVELHASHTGSSAKLQSRVFIADNVISSMPLKNVVFAFDPPPPQQVVEAARRLRYRDFLIVALIIDEPDPFPDNWIYVHGNNVKVSRIQNFRAWSEEMVADPKMASVGMEYFCHEGDGLWNSTDSDLIGLAANELEALGLARRSKIIDGCVVRQPKAYPVYDATYQAAVETIKAWMTTLKNFQTVGRNGMHRYNNQDHSMLTGSLAARNVFGGNHDIWNVNLERSYHEEFVVRNNPAAFTLVGSTGISQHS
jgi:protoporphyrinogen oxidase